MPLIFHSEPTWVSVSEAMALYEQAPLPLADHVRDQLSRLPAPAR
jgi:hypothetical protein